MGDTSKEAEILLEQKKWRTDPLGVLRWLLALRVKNERGEELEWHDRRFLIEPLTDMHQYQVFMKCSQIGLTTIEVLKAYFLAAVLGRGVIYSLPSDKLVQDFSTTKLDPIERANPGIVPTGTDNKGSKSWEKAGFVLLRGTMGQAQDVMVSADHIIADEVNHSDISVVEGLESRLKASKIKAQWWFGHPTFPNVGVHQKWLQSDQREWHVTCRRCGEVQHLDFWANLDRERKCYICRSCGEEITDEDRRKGEWIATNPGAQWHGYHISHMCAPWISAAEVLDGETKPKDFFFGKVLGLPTVGSGITVERSLVGQARVWPRVEGRQKFMGVDVGSGLHVVIGNEHGITKLAYLTDDRDIPKQDEGSFTSLKSKWGKLEQLMTIERINLCVIDNAPDGTKQAEFQKRHRYKVLRCIYDYNPKRAENWEKDDSEGTIKAHRTRLIDETLEAFGKGTLPVYMEEHDPFFDGTGKPDVIENCLTAHWSTLYLIGADGEDKNIVKKDRGGNVIRTWANAGPDHFAHGTIYYRLAQQAGRSSGGKGNSILPGTSLGDKPRRRGDDDDDDAPKGPKFFN